MKFKQSDLKNKGFQGFLTIRELSDGDTNLVPKCGGVYIVLLEIDYTPVFLNKNPGGQFKNKNPTVSKEELKFNWVDNAHTIYIGKGGELRRRIRQLINFGDGKPVGHWGGRLIWQIENSDEFVIAWKYVNDGVEPASLEFELLQEFHAVYGCLPFANLTF